LLAVGVVLAEIPRILQRPRRIRNIWLYRQYPWDDRQDYRSRRPRWVSDSFRRTVGAILTSSDRAITSASITIRIGHTATLLNDVSHQIAPMMCRRLRVGRDTWREH